MKPKNDQTYLNALQKYFRDKNSLIFVDFLHKTFDKETKEFFKALLPKHKFTFNTFLWSFIAKRVLPVYRLHTHLSEDEEKKREHYFTKFEKKLRKYSFARDFSEQDVRDIIYFDLEFPKDSNFSKDNHSQLDVYATVLSKAEKLSRTVIENENSLIISFWKEFWEQQRKKNKKDTEYKITNPTDLLETYKAGISELLKAKNDISHIYFVPIVTGILRKHTGGLFVINSDKVIDGTTIQIIQTYMSGLVDDHQIQEIDYQNRINNINSGAAAIISRNVSHNLGSHIFSYLKDSLRSTERMLEKGLLEDIVIQKKSEYEQVYYELHPKLKKNYEGPRTAKSTAYPNAAYFLGIGRFTGYIQERQDYIATVASRVYPYYSAVNFQELVFDEFIYDQRARRKKENHEKHRNIILEYIALSENYKRKEINIQLEYIDEDGKIYKDLTTLPKVELELPGGVMGRQGIFAILENIIRNTAKHGIKKEHRKTLDITIVIDDRKENNYHDEFFKISIIDNSGNTNENTVQQLNDIMKNDIVDNDGKVKEENKGVKEIQISAGWLRGIEPHQLQENHSPVLMEISHQENNLRYTFYLRKPQVALIISENQSLRDFVNKNYRFWKAMSFKEFKKHQKLTYQFVLIDKNSKYTEQKKGFINGLTPVRTMDFSLKITDLPLDANLFLEQIYKHWLFEKQKIKQEDAELLIVDRVEKEAIQINGLQVISSATEKELESISPKIIYRVHNDTKKDFEAFRQMKTVYQNALFIDGISGGNSTNRLIREEKINQLWYYKIIESALTKILIIDERIWAKFVDKDIDFEYEKYKKKNINILGIESKDDKFVIKDLKNDIVGSINDDGSIKGIQGEKYQFVSIHQGVLDKIGNPKTIFPKFKDTFEADRYLIHSGRSVPASIPVGAAFIQFSSLENSLLDCKFTLTELLYSSIAEKQTHATT